MQYLISWYHGSDYSVFRTFLVSGNIYLAVCVDSHPSPFDILEVNLLDVDFLKGINFRTG